MKESIFYISAVIVVSIAYLLSTIFWHTYKFRLKRKRSVCCKSIFDKVINPSNKRYFLNRCRECGKYCKSDS